MRAGDLNGFLGLALDNLTQLVILSSLLIGVFKFPADLVLQRMVPGTALGVLLGNLAYTWLAVRLMRRTGRADVTAMPFGIAHPVFSALGTSPAALTGEAALGYQALLVLGNGFILIAVLWGWALVAIIDDRLVLAGLLFAVASVATLFGVIHSPMASGALFWPWAAPSATPAHLAGAYGALAALCWLAATRARRISA